VAGMAAPGRCQPTGRDRLKLAPAMLAAGTAVPRMARWIGAWAKRDPKRLHSHFGPFAVDLDLQGKGIGSQLLAEYCRQLDGTGTVSYLETDKPENVRLYERFGFTVTEHAQVIGVDNWFMVREPRAV
jgi:GNAT superfamily N-acetyltransferase